MIGSIGFPEIVLIFIVVLLVFGPKKLPEFAKIMGKVIKEFRKTVNEAKATIESEIEKVDIAEDFKKIDRDIKEATDFNKLIDKVDIAEDLKAIKTDFEEMTDLNKVVEKTGLAKDLKKIDNDLKISNGFEDDKEKNSE
jgi:Tat protein translocase TatB subunit